MRFIALFILSLLFLSINICAQNNEPAIIILKSADTLTGNIIFESDAKLTKGFKFNDGKDTFSLKPTDISELILKKYNVHYKSITFKVQKDSITLISNCILNGPTSLYSVDVNPLSIGLDDAIFPFYVVCSPKGNYPILFNQDPTKKNNKNYPGILIYLLSGCKDYIFDPRSIEYDNAESIAKAIQKYNECSNPNEPNKQYLAHKIPPTVSHQFMFGGFYCAGSQQATYSNGFKTINKYNGNAGLLLGYSLQVVYPGISKKIITDFEFGFYYARFKATNPIDYNKETFFHYYAGRTKILIGYALSESKVQPIIHFGPSFEIAPPIDVFPLLNTGIGVRYKSYYVGTNFEFPFTTTSGSFYSLNFKYTFAKSQKEII